MKKTEIKPGMFWYCDGSFSFIKENKKVKAIVELVEDDTIYGDLSASDKFDDLQEDYRNWYQINRNHLKCHYRCNRKEKIVVYNIKQLEKIYNNYSAIKQAFETIGKDYRMESYWTSTEVNENKALAFSFVRGEVEEQFKLFSRFFRPILAAKLEDR
jgi:hypothetical protein